MALPRKGCLVQAKYGSQLPNGCAEKHGEHYCRVCGDRDSDHRAKYCQAQTHQTLQSRCRVNQKYGPRTPKGCCDDHASHFCKRCGNMDSDHRAAFCTKFTNERKRCRVSAKHGDKGPNGCSENHSKHWCRVCKDKDADHRAKNCASTTKEIMFNGIDLSEKRIKLVKATDCGANILHLQEMHSLDKAKQPLDISFSYNLVSHEPGKEAVVRPAYTPRYLASTVCGHHMRVADDALKLLLKELTCIARTQKAVDQFCGANAGQSITIEYKGGVFRLRIKPKTIVSHTVGDVFMIHDVLFELEYDCGTREPSELERLYIKYCETEWIPMKGKEAEHPFYMLKQVIIAQQLVKYAVAHNVSFDFPAWEPMFLDRCTDLVFPVTEVHTKVFAAVESGVGAAALFNFEKEYKGSDIAVLIKKTNHGYSPPQIVYDLNPDSVQGMELFGEMTEKKPTSPDGGVILAAAVQVQQAVLVPSLLLADTLALVEKEMKHVMLETTKFVASQISLISDGYASYAYSGMSANGWEQLKTDECDKKHKCLAVYPDSLGFLTVGFGHLVLSRDGLKIGDKITPEQSASFLQHDVAIAAQDAQGVIGADYWKNIPQEKKDVLINLAFQLGKHKFSKFEKMIIAIRKQDWPEAQRELMDSDLARTQAPERTRQRAEILGKN